MKILLIEDNEMNRDMLMRRLHRRGYDVETAADGEEGIEAVLSLMPDLVLMDISLPKIDGLQATRILKNTEKTRHIPIIALTAHAMSGDRDRALDAGCEDYDTKPIDLDRLVRKIENRAQKVIDKTVLESKKELDTAVIFNRDELMERIEYDGELLTHILDLFQSHYPQLMIDIQQAIISESAASLQYSSHSLKGLLLEISAPCASIWAQQLEEVSRQGGIGEATHVYVQLKAAMAELNQVLSNEAF